MGYLASTLLQPGIPIWHPTPVLLPGKSHGWRSLVGCSPWGSEELDMTERLHFRFSLSCTGEGNGNPLQCSCLENPRDGGAWWAAIYGVAQSRTRLKQLSSSSSIPILVALKQRISALKLSRFSSCSLEWRAIWSFLKTLRDGVQQKGQCVLPFQSPFPEDFPKQQLLQPK